MKTELSKKNSIYKVFNEIALKNEIVIFGSTYMANFPFYEFTNQNPISSAVYNRSIEGLTIYDALEVVENCVITAHPSKVFLAFGEQDICCEDTIKSYSQLVDTLKKSLPYASLYIVSIPDADESKINFNKSLLKLCDKMKINFISINYAKDFSSVYKQLSLFFRKKQIDFCEAFRIASI